MPRAWTGWVIFAGAVMAVVGVFQIIEALTTLFRRSYQVGHDDLLVRVNYRGWGWIHFIVGVLVLAAGAGLFSGHVWAQVIAVAHLVFIAAYPVWSLAVIFLGIVVIYAVSVHRRELRPVAAGYQP